MQLKYKPDFEQAQRMWDAFWKGENTRPLVSMVLPKPGVEPVEYPPYLAEFFGDFQPVIDQIEAWAETHEFLGEAMPFAFVEWGPDTFSSYIGAELEYSPEVGTSWAVPFVEDWDKTEIRFQREGKWWRQTVDYFHALRERFDGKLLINPPTIVANLDSLAAIRGIERLLYDLVECPDVIQRKLDDVCRVHDEVLTAYAEELDFDTYGSMNVESMYSSGWQSRPQCDMSCMISAEMFREFIVPCLERETRLTAAAHYHLDGPNTVQHIEALCGIEEIGTINFVYGAGNEDRDFSAVHKQIDALGKGQTWYASQEDVKRIWKEMKSPKQFFSTTASSRAEAEDFIAELEAMR